MRELITEDQKHLLWQDEMGDDFLLLKFGEIYRYSEDRIGIYCWNRKTSRGLVENNLILVQDESDDPFDIFFSKVENLEKIMAVLGIPKKKFQKNSVKIKNLEKKLCHKIFPYRSRKAGEDETPDVEIQKEDMSLADAGEDQSSQSDVSGNQRGVAPVESTEQADETMGD